MYRTIQFLTIIVDFSANLSINIMYIHKLFLQHQAINYYCSFRSNGIDK